MTLPELVIDKQLVAELKEFLILNLTDQGVEKMFNDEPVIAYSEAKKAVERAFDALEDMSGAKDKPTVMHNQAR